VLVYGDHDEIISGDVLRRWLEQQRSDVSGRTGLDRHAALVPLLIESGRAWQAIADADFENADQDRLTPIIEAWSGVCTDLARSVLASWESGFVEEQALPALPRLPPGDLRLRMSEGFAYYAVYPEAYADAARRLSLDAPPRVIGIRSIGTTLAAIVAAALDAPPAVTVRPFGNPFAREIAVAPSLERELLAGDWHYVIVDEGPGQSGSSFGAVADWLEARGVCRDRIAFLPSHAGDLGRQSSAAHRQRWRATQRIAADFGAELPRLLRRWLEPLIGALGGPLVDVSGGGWRPLLDPAEAHWPAVVPAWERRKFLATAGGRKFLVKFAGLGAIGERKLAIARTLHAAGWTPKPIGLAHGFIVEEWLRDAGRVQPGDTPVGELGRYIGTRANLFSAGETDGASLMDLLVMIRRNASLALGDAVVETANAWEPKLASMRGRLLRVRTDNRMLRHEWMRSADGRLLKSDALDHHAGHDLIGCQDMAWDIAGAISEFDLDDGQAEALIAAAECSASRPVDRELLSFYRLAYAAFRLGQLRLGAEMTASDSAEVQRLNDSGARFEAKLHQLLQQRCFGTPLRLSAK
jgi:hypothetical protein